MISHVSGTLLTKELDRIEIMTAGGVGYELSIPLSVFETLPRAGEAVSLHTHLVVKEDGWQLFGFVSVLERSLFQLVLSAKGVGPSLALALLSTLTADRLVRALREKDVATLQSVPRVGRKKAEQLILDLADKLGALQVEAATPGATGPVSPGADDAVRALVSLGYNAAEADRAVRAALGDGDSGQGVSDLIRKALASVGR